MTYIITITGPDGAGKSSVCALLAKQLLPHAKIINIWDSLKNSPFYSCKSCIYTYLKNIDPVSRSLLILHGIAQSLYGALKEDHEYVIIDGYWHKYAVTEIALSGCSKQFEFATNVLPRSHFTFFLNAKPTATAARKDILSDFEVGLVECYDRQAQFLHFQSLVYSEWQRIRLQNPDWHEIDTHNISASKAARFIYQTIKNRGFIRAH